MTFAEIALQPVSMVNRREESALMSWSYPPRAIAKAFSRTLYHS